MNSVSDISKSSVLTKTYTQYGYLLRALFAGLLIPLGFAPFHLPGLVILGLALLFAQLQNQNFKRAFLIGFVFGLGYFAVGVSWVAVSIHDYGHLSIVPSALITFLFLLYLAVYPGIAAALYIRFSVKTSLIFSCLLFSALWCLSEFLRASLMSGFPWLLLGFGQIDTPLKYLLPLIGVFGVSFFVCLSATFLASSTFVAGSKRYLWIIAFILVLLAPNILKNKEWVKIDNKPISTGIIQADLSMKDKWDETLFWHLLDHYKNNTEKLMNNDLIVMPESAIPLPSSYVSEFLGNIHKHAKLTNTSVILGIPQPASNDESYYYNSLITLGQSKGAYLKQHLVPFGEFIPAPFKRLNEWLGLPDANMKPGHDTQPLVRIKNHPIATLICYELAYPSLLRKQLPEAEWIVSISDDGWFGHSLAMYQQLQMAQVLSLQTGRYQVVANNDGLSSIINHQGELINSLPAFTAGVLQAKIYPAKGISPWVLLGDKPILFASLLTTLIGVFRIRTKYR